MLANSLNPYLFFPLVEFLIEKNKDLLNATIELQEESEILVDEFNTKEKQCEQNEEEIRQLNNDLKKEIALKEKAEETVGQLNEQVLRLKAKNQTLMELENTKDKQLEEDIKSGKIIQVKKEDLIKKEDFDALLVQIDDKVNQLNAKTLEINKLQTQNDQIKDKWNWYKDQMTSLENELGQANKINQELMTKVSHYKDSAEQYKEKCTVFEEEFFKLKQQLANVESQRNLTMQSNGYLFTRSQRASNRGSMVASKVGVSDLINFEDGLFHENNVQFDTANVEHSQGSQEPIMYQEMDDHVFYNRPEMFDAETQAEVFLDEQLVQTDEWLHFNNFSTALRLNADQSEFIGDILEKMVKTGLTDVVEWKKPKKETLDQETNTENKSLSFGSTQTEIKEFSQSACQTAEKEISTQETQTEVHQVVETGMQTTILEYRDAALETTPPELADQNTQCFSNELNVDNECQTDEIVIKGDNKKEVFLKEQYVQTIKFKPQVRSIGFQYDSYTENCVLVNSSSQTAINKPKKFKDSFTNTGALGFSSSRTQTTIKEFQDSHVQTQNAKLVAGSMQTVEKQMSESCIQTQIDTNNIEVQTVTKLLSTTDTQTVIKTEESQCQTSKDEYIFDAMCQTNPPPESKNEVCSTFDLIELQVRNCQTDFLELLEVGTNTETQSGWAKDQHTNTEVREQTESSIQVNMQPKTFNIHVQTDVIPELVKLDDPTLGARQKRIRESIVGPSPEFMKIQRKEILKRRINGGGSVAGDMMLKRMNTIQP